MKIGIDYIGVGCWAIVINDNNQVLLIKKKGRDFWERPGGKVEFGETLENSIVREVKEEVGIDTKIEKFIFFEQILDYNGKEHWLAFCFHLKYLSGKIKNQEPNICDDFKWFSLTNLPDNLSPYTKNAINKYLAIVK